MGAPGRGRSTGRLNAAAAAAVIFAAAQQGAPAWAQEPPPQPLPTPKESPGQPQAEPAAAGGPKPVSFVAWASNWGDPDVDENEYGAGVILRDDWLHGVRARGFYRGSFEDRARQGDVDVTAGLASSFRVTGFAEYVDLDFPVGRAPVEAHSRTYGGYAQYLLPGSEGFQHNVAARLTVLKSWADVESLRVQDQRLTTAQVAYAATWSSPTLSRSVRLNLLHSIPSATDIRTDVRTLAGLPAGPEDYGLIEGGATLGRRFPPLWEALLSVGGQYAFDPIPSAHQYRYGGARYGGAFHPNSLLGDNGAGASLEVRRQTRLPWPERPVQFYARVDGAWVRSRHIPFSRPEDRAVSVGVGVRADLVEQLSVQAEFDRPVVEPRFVRTDPDRFLVRAVARF
jgi:hemolysin activation/secretion protein